MIMFLKLAVFSVLDLIDAELLMSFSKVELEFLIQTFHIRSAIWFNNLLSIQYSSNWTITTCDSGEDVLTLLIHQLTFWNILHLRSLRPSKQRLNLHWQYRGLCIESNCRLHFVALLLPNPSGFNKLESEFLKAETISRLAVYFMASVSLISRTRKRLHYVRILILCFEIWQSKLQNRKH